MKKILSLIMAIIIVAACAAVHAEAVDLSVYTDDELRELRTKIDIELSARQATRALEGGTLLEGDIGEYHVALLSLERAKEYNGNPAVVLTIMFTNNGKDDDSYSLSIRTGLFQNGIELSRAISIDKEIDTWGPLKDIRPGASLEIQEAYVLIDENAPIEIEFGKLFDFSKEPLKLIGTFAIE